MVERAALDPPRRLAQLGERAVGPAEQFVEPGQRFAGLGPGLHRRALLGQRGLLARLGRERVDFGGGMGQPVAIARGAVGFGAGLGQFAFEPRDLGPGRRDRRRCRSGRRRRARRGGPWG